MSEEKLKNVTAIIQNIIVTIAVIVGGIWTLYTFKALGHEEKAKYDIVGRPSLNIEIQTKTTKATNPSYYTGLIIEVNIENRGSRYMNLLTLDSVLCVSQIGTVNNSQMQSVKNFYLEPVMQYDVNNSLIMSMGIQPNSKKTISYYCELDKPGIYFIRFVSNNSKEINDELRSMSNSPDTASINKVNRSLNVTNYSTSGYWFAGKYIEIE